MMTYEQAIASCNRKGPKNATDAEAMAGVLASTAQLLLGAVSPKLIWEGAQAKGLTLLELTRLIQDDPESARDLMWT